MASPAKRRPAKKAAPKRPATAQPATNSPAAERQDDARAKAQAIRAEQARKERRTRMLLIGAAVAVVAIVAVVVAVILQQRGQPAAQGDTTKPAIATASDGYSFGSTLVGGTDNAGAVTVEMWSDYMCPGCGAYEQQLGPVFEQLLRAGDITLVIHPISFLDSQSQGTAYSTRATTAVAVVADKDPAHLLPFHEALFASQPQEKTPGLTDQQIADLARGAGVSEEVAGSLTSTQFTDWVAQATRRALDKVPSTPYIEIAGQQWAPTATGGSLPDQFTAAVRAAQ